MRSKIEIDGSNNPFYILPSCCFGLNNAKVENDFCFVFGLISFELWNIAVS